VCLATVYVENGGQREEVMCDVAWVQPESCGLRLLSLMGESKLLQAKIVRIDLLSSAIVLRTTAERPQTTSANHTG
jgi:predicted RNA-binding protein